MKNSIYFWLVFCLFLINGCYKEEPDPNPYTIPLYIPPVVKDYMYFKPGTYWIYKEDKSGVEDSVFVYSASSGLDTFKGNGNTSLKGIMEWMQVYTASSLDSSENKYWVHMSWSSEYNDYVKVMRNGETTSGFYFGETILLFYPFIIGNTLYPWTQDGVVSCSSLYENYYIASNVFPQVVKFNDSENITENKNQTNFYISKHYGIIKKELMKDAKIWNLTRFKIIQ